MYAIRSYYDISALGISSAEIYKWVDENGVTHYSDSPTEDIPGDTATENDEIQSADPPAADVITSYSIHYTKLYDEDPQMSQHDVAARENPQ